MIMKDYVFFKEGEDFGWPRSLPSIAAAKLYATFEAQCLGCEIVFGRDIYNDDDYELKTAYITTVHA